MHPMDSRWRKILDLRAERAKFWVAARSPTDFLGLQQTTSSMQRPNAKKKG
jgi:3-dehydroquinate dehydratase